MTLEEMLQASPWAGSLTRDQLAHVMAGITERTAEAGTLFCRRGEQVECWFGMLDGLMKISSDRENGKTSTLTGVSPGGWFGEGSMLKAEPRRYDAIALRNSRVACMRRETFNWLLDNSIAFNRFLLTQLNERLGMVIGLLESERLLDVDTRVARCLAALFHPVLYPGLGNRLAISQEEMAYLVGVSRQRVNRSLKLLQSRGFLSTGYGGITILNLDGLRRFGD